MTQKEKGVSPEQTAPRENHARNSTERPLYLPLTWRENTLVPNRIAYRVSGRLAGLLVLALVAGALLVGGLQ